MLWLTIALSGLATFAVRALPFFTPVAAPSSAALRRYLDALPTAVIAALAGGATLAPGDRLTGGAELAAALVTIAVTLRWRSLLAAVLSGVATLAVLRALGPG